MKKLKVVTIAAAMLCAPTAFADGRVAFGWDLYHVPGESLDSGLGRLSPQYTGAEFMNTELKLVGQKLDSGLGKLSKSYTGAEYMTELQLVGESQDSGLGNLSASYTGAEFMNTELRIVGESIDSGLGELTKADVNIIMITAMGVL